MFAEGSWIALSRCKRREGRNRDGHPGAGACKIRNCRGKRRVERVLAALRIVRWEVSDDDVLLTNEEEIWSLEQKDRISRVRVRGAWTILVAELNRQGRAWGALRKPCKREKRKKERKKRQIRDRDLEIARGSKKSLRLQDRPCKPPASISFLLSVTTIHLVLRLSRPSLVVCRQLQERFRICKTFARPPVILDGDRTRKSSDRDLFERTGYLSPQKCRCRSRRRSPLIIYAACILASFFFLFFFDSCMRVTALDRR